ncbi:putative SAM domain methyltransferase [Aspergillus nomiae NRRL 13137]|uniref:Putative SAM domain methyltransferase n=1 Tax=Aspergillus nomiae NRRL (strain ATCC 15546 / NRRL 13137 / CBS 260.88 / M93) TaxID=1509407 RepID=A0A0L1IUW5_ASPN3|nr:putative SAM domain methyltransferase [Aspergillus nomiae NRRL 13137]KNG82938.1 putative SAM domain methyltransferase [Aspergillus nomiae NRRL 13137]
MCSYPHAGPPIDPEADADLYSDEDYSSAMDGGIMHIDKENMSFYFSHFWKGHHICSLVLAGALYRSPISENPRRILDIGTGTGLWAIDMAEYEAKHIGSTSLTVDSQYPEAQVIGTDLSPIQPSWVPPNCAFEIDDFELPWNFAQPFDFIHARSVEGSVKDFPHLFRQAHQHLVPGGWFEMMEPTVGIFSDDDSISNAPYLSEWRDMLIEASRKFGKEMGVAKNYKQWMTEAGFTDVTEEIFKVPFSPWAKDPKLKELGRYQQANMLEALDAYSLALFTRFLGWSVDQIQVLLVGVRRELLDRRLHIYSRYYLVYGRKEKEDS